MFYQIQEGSVELPGEWQDRSVNVLIPQDTNSKGANLVISRDSVPRGLPFADYLQQQRKILARELPDFQVQLDAAGADGQRPVHNLEFTWTNQGKAMRQLMTLIGCGDSVLSLTASIPKGSEDAIEILQRAMNSLTFDPRTGTGG